MGGSVDGSLDGEGDKLFHLLRCHTSRLGHYHHSRCRQVGKHIHLGVCGRIKATHKQQDGRCQHHEAIVQCEMYYLIHISFL